MIGRWIRRVGSVFEHWRRGAFLAAAVMLIGAVPVPTASAGLVKDVVDTVGSTVKSVQASPNAVPPPVPPPPSTTPPAKPPEPPSAAATPAPPPRTPVKLPSKEPSPSPSRAEAGSRSEAGSVDPPSRDGVGRAVQNTVDSVTSITNEATSRAAKTSERSNNDGSERSGNGPAMAPQHRADQDASEAIVRRSRTTSSPPVAVRAAEVAALQRWLARVWPAIALGGGEISRVGAVEVIAGDLFRPALAAIAGVLLASSPVPLTSGDPPLGGDQGVAGASRSAPPPAPVAGEGGGIVYLIAIAGLLALLGFTVWREFRIALHPGLH